MQPPQPTPETAHGPASPDAGAPELAGDALARRRLLLKGLGKGAGVVAVLAPMQTLAAPMVMDAEVRLCTVSGIQSNVGSGRAGGTTEQCRGYVPPHFSVLANWPGYNPGTQTATNTVKGVSFTQATPFATVFGSAGGLQTPLLAILQASAPASELVWTTALLNAIKRGAVGLGPSNPGTMGYFPYTPAQVVDLYNDPAKRADAEFFFSNYLQNES